MNDAQYTRMRDFSGPISDAARDNPTVNAVLDAYRAGAIITKEEALSKMVVLLAKDWGEQARANFEMAMNMPRQTFRIEIPRGG